MTTLRETGMAMVVYMAMLMCLGGIDMLCYGLMPIHSQT